MSGKAVKTEMLDGLFASRTDVYTVNAIVTKKPTYLDVLDVGPMEGNAPLSFHLHCTLNETDGPGLNGKDVDLFVDGVKAQTIESHGIFGWYGAIGWVNGCCDFTIELGAGTHDIYAKFSGDSEYQEVKTTTYTVKVTIGPPKPKEWYLGWLIDQIRDLIGR